jgi:hypothetical protein
VRFHNYVHAKRFVFGKYCLTIVYFETATPTARRTNVTVGASEIRCTDALVEVDTICTGGVVLARLTDTVVDDCNR